jgi:hypothetical protein
LRCKREDKRRRNSIVNEMEKEREDDKERVKCTCRVEC